MTAINDLLVILEQAKGLYGGDHKFCILDDDGNKIEVSGLDYMVTCRGDQVWEELYFV